MEDESGQEVIGNGTDPTEFVAWHLVLPLPGNYSVEMRYACPDETDGVRNAYDDLEPKGPVLSLGHTPRLHGIIPLSCEC